jgi:hypothetical protein
MDEIIVKFGNYGKYQWYLFALCSVPSVLMGAQTLMYNWTAYTPAVRWVASAHSWTAQVLCA